MLRCAANRCSTALRQRAFVSSLRFHSASRPNALLAVRRLGQRPPVQTETLCRPIAPLNSSSHTISLAVSDRNLVPSRSFFGSWQPERIKHKEKKLINFTPEQVYDVVIDVDRYKEFLPFCVNSSIPERKSETKMYAMLEIGFKMFTERYMSEVDVKRPEFVKIKAIESRVFSYLLSCWRFEKVVASNGTIQCLINFEVDFEVSSPLHAQAVNMFFSQVAQKQIAAFEQRCATLYRQKPDPVARPRVVPSAQPVLGASAVQAPAGSSTPTPPTPQQILEMAEIGTKLAQENSELQSPFALSADNLRRYTETEVLTLRGLFLRYSPDRRSLDYGGFRNLCTELQTKNVLWVRFRDRYVLKAAAVNSDISKELWECFPLNSAQRVTFDDFLSGLFYLTKATPDERFKHIFNGRGLMTVQELHTSTKKYFDLQLGVVGQVMPDMVHKRSQETLKQFPQLQADPVGRGVRELALLGVMQNVLESLNNEVDEAIDRIFSEVSGFRDVSLDLSSETVYVSVEEWAAAWQKHGQILEMISVLGISSLIEWAFALEEIPKAAAAIQAKLAAKQEGNLQ